jgi:hypothetical protein
MQQLFPAEGEREPKRRFKAFSGEWEKKEVHNVFAILAGGDVPKNEAIFCCSVRIGSKTGIC